jgi:Uma2 family endonuclease
MASTVTPTLTLEQFLQQSYIEESPAWEYVAGQAVQKPMPQVHHSRLQLKLAAAIDTVAEPQTVAAAFPELRCTFGGRSIVPDIAVLTWSQIPLTEAGELEGCAIAFAPVWTIEILSPSQKSTKVIANIVHCLDHGSQLGWLIDPDDRAIFSFCPNQELRIYRGEDYPPVLSEIEWQLTVNQIFQWLQMKR